MYHIDLLSLKDFTLPLFPGARNCGWLDTFELVSHDWSRKKELAVVFCCVAVQV